MFAMENKVGEDVGRVNATDKDEKNGENWRITYSIIKGDSSGNFAIRTDPVTNQGIISVVNVSTFINITVVVVKVVARVVQGRLAAIFFSAIDLSASEFHLILKSLKQIGNACHLMFTFVSFLNK